MSYSHCTLSIQAITHNQVTILDPSNRVPHDPSTNMNEFGSNHLYNIKQLENLETFSFQFKPQPTTVLDCVKPVIEIFYPLIPSFFGTKPYGFSWPLIDIHTIPNTIAYNMPCNGHVISQLFTSTQPCNLHTWCNT